MSENGGKEVLKKEASERLYRVARKIASRIAALLERNDEEERKSEGLQDMRNA